MYQHHYLSLKDGDTEAPTHEWAQAYKADNGRLKAPPEPAQNSTSCVVTSRNDVKRPVADSYQNREYKMK